MPEDVAHYVRLAREADGPIVELGGRNGPRRDRRSCARPASRYSGSTPRRRCSRSRASGRPGCRSSCGSATCATSRSRSRRRSSTSRAAPFSICTAGGRSATVFERVARSLRPGGRFAFNAFAFSHTVAARLDGQTLDQNGVVHTLTLRARRQPRRTSVRDDGATIRLWWATKSEWEGLHRRRRARGRGAVRRVRAASRSRTSRPSSSTSLRKPA